MEPKLSARTRKETTQEKRWKQIGESNYQTLLIFIVVEGNIIQVSITSH